MNLENSIKDVIAKKLENGTIEKLFTEQLENGINRAIGELFGNYGDCTKIIESKIKDVMVPYLENHDYSEYIVKLDSVVVNILKNATLDNKKILENFKELMIQDDRKSIKATELFNIWKEYVAKNVETDDLEVDYDDGVSYESVEVSFEFIEDDDRSWSNFEWGKIVFACEHDEEMNFEIRLSRYKKSKDELWDISYRSVQELSSLRYIKEFEILLMRLNQADVKIELDERYDSDGVIPEKEPEASWA